MKRIKTVGLCLVAVFAFSAVAAASASAGNIPPKFMKCEKTAKNGEHKYTGTYIEKECKAPASPTEITEGKTNAYALVVLPRTPEVPVTGKGKSVVITTEGGKGNWQVIVCGKSAFEGKLYNQESGNGKVEPLTVTFEKCEGKSNPEGKATEAACESEGAAEPGTITFGTYATSTYWLEDGEAKPSLSLGGAPTFKCGGEEVEMHGALTSTLENTPKGLTLSWTVGGSTRSQAPSDYWEPEYLDEEFFHTRWYTGEEEVNEEQEATVAGIVALKTEVKEVSVRKESEAS